MLACFQEERTWALEGRWGRWLWVPWRPGVSLAWPPAPWATHPFLSTFCFIPEDPCPPIAPPLVEGPGCKHGLCARPRAGAGALTLLVVEMETGGAGGEHLLYPRSCLVLGPSHQGGTLIASLRDASLGQVRPLVQCHMARKWELWGRVVILPTASATHPMGPPPPSRSHSQDGGSPAWNERGKYPNM